MPFNLTCSGILVYYFCRSSRDLVDYYIDLHFYGHLCAATTVFLDAQDISDEHPAIEILHDLETLTYSVDKDSPFFIFMQAQHIIIHVILRWADMLNCHLKVGVPYVL